MGDRLRIKFRNFVIDPLLASLARGEGSLARIEHSVRAAHLAALATSERYADARCLTRHGYRSTSQNDEDGIIEEIFRRIGTTNRRFVEFGVETGVENNTLALLLAGWRGLWIEGDPAAQREIRKGFGDALSDGLLDLKGSMVTAENIEALLEHAHVPEEPDLLSIDIDGNDYWVWKAIRRFRPRVVVIEYNATLGRTARSVLPYDPAARWDGTIRFGASLSALEDLGREKGYGLVGCGLTGVNAFFVREDCLGDRLFLEPFTAEQHFEPPRFGATGAGHPARWVRFEHPEAPHPVRERAPRSASTK
jgi:hypothetical protein